MSMSPSRVPPALYPVTDTRIAGLALPEVVGRLVDGGATWIQVREKEMKDRDLARTVEECCRIQGPRILVNDRADVALVAGAGGVHLGDRDLPAAEARALLGPSPILGVSTHSVEEAVAACSREVDYVALGPIFTTPNASVRREALGIGALREASRRMSLPLVAIGGITLERASEVLEAGATSVAVISDLMNAPDMAARVRAYLDLAPGGR